ncbi:MAG: cyclic nucleotide-binding domain-containing protein [Ferrovibrio sp.]|jgi:CRP-like cAMP-binding protein|uniref:cyclic nucleotide-binding domain-containing protein n=1 Tax=Ferrovibrio sp. TaxID=1917215 RepID=UPI00391C254B
MSEGQDQDIRFGRGATLLEQGAHGDFCYLILSGRVEVFRMDGDAKLCLAEMGEGGVVGEMALIDPAPRAASVVAIEPTVCRRINAAALDRALQAAPPLARYLLQTFIRNIRHADGIAPPAQGIRIGTGDLMATAIQSEQGSRILDRKVYATGETIFRAGQPGYNVYLVQSGRVELVREMPDGSQKRLRCVEPGEVFGELALLTGEPRRASAIASEATVCEHISASHFNAILNVCPAIVKALMRIYAGRMMQIALPSRDAGAN